MLEMRLFYRDFFHKVIDLTFKRRIKSNPPFAGIIMRAPCSPTFQDQG